MATYGLWIDIEFCTGCRACEVACLQEHGFDPDLQGIVVQEVFANGGRTFDYVPVPTALCNLCAERTRRGALPACVHHCMAQVMAFGPVEELAARMAVKSRSVIFAPLRMPRAKAGTVLRPPHQVTASEEARRKP